MKNIIDISMEISPEIAVYMNRENMKPVFTNLNNHQKSDVYQTQITINLHTGTHIDAPLHMIKGGKDSEIIDNQICSCRVLDLTDVKEKITDKDLKDHAIKENEFLLFKTQNSFGRRGSSEFIYLTEEGAKYLIDKNIRGVGIDALGIERAQSGHPTHKILLEKEITLVEGLDLKNVNSAEYTLILLPLKINGVEAVPAKAVLVKK